MSRETMRAALIADAKRARRQRLCGIRARPVTAYVSPDDLYTQEGHRWVGHEPRRGDSKRDDDA